MAFKPTSDTVYYDDQRDIGSSSSISARSRLGTLSRQLANSVLNWENASKEGRHDSGGAGAILLVVNGNSVELRIRDRDRDRVDLSRSVQTAAVDGVTFAMNQQLTRLKQ